VSNTDDEDAQGWLREHRASALLSSLVLIGDDDAALEGFAKRLPNPSLTVDDLRAAKALATALCEGLLSKRPADWRPIARAHEALGARPSVSGTLRGAPAPVPAHDPEDEAPASSARAEAACFPLSVDDYAAFVARSQNASLAQLEQLYTEYGIDDAAHHKRIDQVFSIAFAQNATLRTQFTEALRQWAGWLSSA